MKDGVFEWAAAVVKEWLDHGSGATWARRDTRRRIEEGLAWDIDLQDDALAIKAVRIVVPPNFPATTCQLYVDRSYFLRMPHVEANGHVCLGLTPIPSDYEEPVGAILRALETLKDRLLVPAADSRWVEQQFHDERASYWTQFCLLRTTAPDRRPVAARIYADVGSLESFSRGSLAGYVPAGSKRRILSLQVATATSVDPHDVAVRHRWADGMMVRGDALFVRLPSDLLWTPTVWPQSFEALDALVGRATGQEYSLRRWLQETGWLDDSMPRSGKRKSASRHQRGAEAPKGQRPLLVVLVQDGSMFGYQLFGPAIPHLQPPRIEPVGVTRVDPDWALARDHEIRLLHSRRKRRVLLLGCGSLGSPLAKALARAGIGHLSIVDAQLMETENTCRHELGLSDTGHGKAAALACRLMRDVPGLSAQGIVADAVEWATRNCLPGMYDLVVECTAESSVRTFIANTRRSLFGDCPVIHAWAEPLCSAGHVVLTQTAVPWPHDDPADTLVNASDLSASDTQVNTPACSGGFHPYGAADIDLVAAFAAELRIPTHRDRRFRKGCDR